ncbi:hypothetical protein DESC_240094 [Desulfosarcina cetonica]|nr:hypothetical protein DESC_240094 [Desulfosarcina cetonica]
MALMMTIKNNTRMHIVVFLFQRIKLFESHFMLKIRCSTSEGMLP